VLLQEVDTLPKEQPSHSSLLNHYKRKQEFTQVEVKAGDYVIQIPDTERTYGDSESVAQMAQDVAGKHSDNKTAKIAYEAAREQHETLDFAEKRRQQRYRNFTAKKPMASILEHKDNAGVLRGYTVTFTYTATDSGLLEVSEQYVSIEQMLKGV
jgi:hypothetical protein